MAQAMTEYQETGKLSDEMRKQLDEVDYEDMFQQMSQIPVAEDVADLTQEEMSAIKNYVGGEEQYEGLMDWAANTLDKNYVDAFDDLVQNGSAQGNPTRCTWTHG